MERGRDEGLVGVKGRHAGVNRVFTGYVFIKLISLSVQGQESTSETAPGEWIDEIQLCR